MSATFLPSLTRRVTHRPPLAALKRRLHGALLMPDDPDYAAVATPWNVAVPSAPAGVVRAADAHDVRAAVVAGFRAGLRVDVRATGHGAAPTDATTLLVHTADLDELVIHPEGWARVGAGVRWTQLLEEAAPYGLAPLCGSAPDVGVVGFLTGGGLGPLARTHGLGSDHVRSFDVVTGDGKLRRATPTENPDLFWGLRGGKGALGIVTAVELDLLPITQVFGGCLYFDGADADVVAKAWAAWVTGLPEAATTSLAILRLPPLPAVPAPLAGRCTVAVRFVWTGDSAAGAATIMPLQSAAPVIFGGVGEMPYREIGMVHADPRDPMPSTESAVLLETLPSAAVDALISVVGPDTDCPQVLVEVRHLGGAVARRPDHGDAMSHRDAAFTLLAVGIGVPPAVGPTQAHAAQIKTAMAPWTTGGNLPNFGGAPTVDSVRECYDPATLRRLQSLAAHYDPNGVLAGNRSLHLATPIDD